MGPIHQKFACKKVGDTEKCAKLEVECACSEMNVVRSFDRKFFLCSDFKGRLLFSESSPNLTFPSPTETVSLLVARTEGNGLLPVPGEDWEVDGRQIIRQATSLRDRQVPPKPVHCVSK